MEKNKVKVVVCCHNSLPANSAGEQYFLLQVGKRIHSDIDLRIQGDDAGKNISQKNNSYCELTGLYWAWKNLDAEVIGLCHYRRFFDFHHQCRPGFPYTSFSESEFKDFDLRIPENVIEKISKGLVITSSSMSFRYSVASEYCIAHISDDLRTLESVIEETQSQNVIRAFKKHLYASNTRSAFNMLIMNRDNLDKYCTWLFEILSKVESKIDISNYNSCQRRIFGYMAERLLDVWIDANNIKAAHVPVIKVTEEKDLLSQISRIRYLIRRMANRIICFLSAEYR